MRNKTNIFIHDTLEINVYDKDGNFLGKDTLKVRETNIPELFVRV